MELIARDGASKAVTSLARSTNRAASIYGALTRATTVRSTIARTTGNKSNRQQKQQ